MTTDAPTDSTKATVSKTPLHCFLERSILRSHAWDRSIIVVIHSCFVDKLTLTQKSTHIMIPQQNTNASRPKMTPEENEQVQKFLSELEVMEKEDPQQFAQVIAQLGIGAGGPGPEGGGPEGMGNAKNVVEAISQMRASAAEGMNMNTSRDKDIQLPDGKTMSNGGVQAKVR